MVHIWANRLALHLLDTRYCNIKYRIYRVHLYPTKPLLCVNIYLRMLKFSTATANATWCIFLVSAGEFFSVAFFSFLFLLTLCCLRIDTKNSSICILQLIGSAAFHAPRYSTDVASGIECFNIIRLPWKLSSVETFTRASF